ncbi:MAG: CRISPR-associated endonuclease Cas6 [Bacteroidia bacterium]
MHNPLITLSLDLGDAKPSIYAFRSAFIQLREFEKDDWFHNHFRDEGNHRVHNRYAFVQYKVVNGRYIVLCMADAVREEVMQFFYAMPRSLNLYQKEVPFRVESCKFEEFPFVMSPTLDFEYKVSNYIALNPEKYLEYKKLATHHAIAAFLEERVANHLIAYQKAIHAPYPRPYRLEVKLTDYPKFERMRSNDHEVLAFELAFKTNLLLPEYLGIGKDTAKGMGVIRRVEHSTAEH